MRIHIFPCPFHSFQHCSVALNSKFLTVQIGLPGIRIGNLLVMRVPLILVLAFTSVTFRWRVILQALQHGRACNFQHLPEI